VVAIKTASRWSTKRAFKGEWIYQLKITPHDNSRCSFFNLLNCKTTVFKVEVIKVLIEHHGEYSFFQLVILFRLTISKHKQVHICRMTMKITEEEDRSRIKSLLHHQLSMVISRVQLVIGSNPLPIEVNTCQTASIIANNDTIRVQHRYDFKDESVS